MEYKFRVRNEETGEIVAYEKLTPSGWVFCYVDALNTWCNGVFALELMGDGYLNGLKREMWATAKDINGTDVYEGDIIKYTEYNSSDADRPNCIDEVEFDTGSFLPVSEGYCQHVEVIGNTTDNPELLSV
jgi:hypothetical protein